MAEREAGVSLAQFALAWVLRRQEVGVVQKWPILGNTELARFV
jgi:aryl-alcohol dehydrogenase-like predicted oxidoreductase